ncbi:cupin domain-containing protein [Maricaulis sp. MIT060901]|uniref:cupin domain-containing protein n=1 Tax=Maricaulis sp. MIT060901 TaxID=3096993 RepID=UPI003999AC7B
MKRPPPVVSLDKLQLDTLAHGEKFEAQLGRIGPVIGMEQLGAMLTVVPPGKRAFPCHNHHVIEEAMIILAGEGEYRFGDDVHPTKAGDVIAAPAGGRDRAHQIINTGTGELRYDCFSTMQKTDVVEYPDSNKVGAITWGDESGQGDGVLFRHRAYAQEVDYWEGEE